MQEKRMELQTMSGKHRALEGWFYKQAGETLGPVSAERLKELLTLGLLRPGQAVWKNANQCVLFVHAATAASSTTR
jgi:hypothetical protein